MISINFLDDDCGACCLGLGGSKMKYYESSDYIDLLTEHTIDHVSCRA